MASATVTAIEKAGVVGAGGGGFPTHVKAGASADVVLANGAECEPLLRADTELVMREADRVVRGVALLSEAVGASRAVIAFKSKNTRALGAVERAIREHERVGGAEIELVPLSNVYPAGDEFLLVFETTGRVVPEGGIPLDVGVVVSNVTTLKQVADAVEGRPVTRRFVTVQGEVAGPVTLDVPVGTDIGLLIDRAGGSTVGDYRVIVGGPMMGHLMSPGEPTTKTTSGAIVLPEDHPLVGFMAAREEQVLRLARAACCQCMACTELCPRYLLGHDLEPHRTVRAVQYADFDENHSHITSAYLCCECGMCELFSCPLGIQPRRILADLKKELQERGVPNPHTRDDLTPDGVREYRQIPSSRLTRRLGLARYDGEAPLDPEQVAPSSVTLNLRQHVGAPAEPVVKESQQVLEGDLVAEVPDNTLSARVHSSVTGKVTEVSGSAIVVTAGSRE